MKLKSIFKQLRIFTKSIKSWKILIMIQKNSEYERGIYLNFFGETLIFFGSILNLIWINEIKKIKWNLNIQKKRGPLDLPH